MISTGAEGALFEMQLERGNRTYAPSGRCAAGSLPVERGWSSARCFRRRGMIVTGEKLQRYLSEELRDRIRNSRARVRILDHLSHRQLVVEPREFSGERIAVTHRWPTPTGDVLAELYFQTDGDGARPGGRRLQGRELPCSATLRQLEQFQHSPWTDGRMAGVLDFRGLRPSAGHSQRHIVPD